MTLPDNIKEEIEKEAEEYAENLYPLSAIIGKADSIKLQILNAARKQVKEIYIQGATKFYERVMQKLKAERRRAFEAGADVEGYADNYGEEIGVNRTFETFVAYEKSLEGEK